MVDGIDQAYFGVAFARSSGVDLLHDALMALGPRAKVFVGIRNDITSAQALTKLLGTGVQLFAVDTGRATEIFHSKLYVAKRGNRATVLVGSPNLTSGGLEGNIEVSTAIDLDLNDQADRAYLEDIEDSIGLLENNYPQNVVRITSRRQIAALLRDGRLADETIRRLPTTTAAAPDPKERESVPRMALARRARVPRPIPTRPRLRLRTRRGWALVWESDELSERDLNIPTGMNTNPTGSMTLRKGKVDDIDQRHYFRDEVFRGLNWAHDVNPATRHLESATAQFEVVVKGVRYGTHQITIRHNPRTDVAAYRQRNAMTHLRWGELRDLVARADLLDSTLRIYRREGTPPTFALEIV